MSKIWDIKENADENVVKHLSAALNVNMSIANLLAQRGITSFEEARSFFYPRLEHLHDPFLMLDMEAAVSRLERAINNQEKVLIYGDYDVDGTTSVALMYQFLRNRIKHLDYYIPDRYSEGYGISNQSIEFAHENNFSLIIALDCGIKAVAKVEKAQGYGIDFIICDHHTPDEIIPAAVAVLNPKRENCGYPYKELSACGVGFKFIQAYSLRHNTPIIELYDLLDLVAVSIASDIVPVTGENRVLAYHGLKKLNENPSLGLKTIMKLSNASNTELTLSDVVFKIGPRLNASGRIEHGKSSVDLLVMSDSAESSKLGEEIDSFNEIRKKLDRDITQEALDMITHDPLHAARVSTVLYNRDWHKGVVGIVASRLTEHYYRPTIILTESNGMATGSARSVHGFDLYEAVGQCADLLESYGGHMYATGLTLHIENIPEFSRRFEEIVAQNISEKQKMEIHKADSYLRLSEITPKFFRSLHQFEPFGPGNNRPTFVTTNIADSGKARCVGKESEHLKLDITDLDTSETCIPAIAFNQGKMFPLIEQGNPFDIIYTITENEFRGRKNLQLMIKDIDSNLIY
ncbi:MAG: single-stranded-DNA-specific exonuclease RecJ [Mangrovibacterium sp.]